MSAAEQTSRLSKIDSDSLRKRLAQAALLLQALPAMPAAPALVFRSPGGKDVESISIGTGVAVGRGEGCEIRFEARNELSRRHFAIRPAAQGFIVEDIGSSNGTRVAGVTGKIQRRELRDGDLIQAGGVDFLFVRAE